MIKFRIVKNHWGWSLGGIAVWVHYGWGLFHRWSVQGGAADGRDLQCCKLGPVAWNWPGEAAQDRREPTDRRRSVGCKPRSLHGYLAADPHNRAQTSHSR